VELDYADGESDFPDAATSLSCTGGLFLILSLVALLF
jgi:hypothetical protein